MTTPAETPKTTVEKLVLSFKEWASKTLGEVGELDAVALIADWNIGKSDFPAGMLFGRDKKFALTALASISAQTNKMLARICEMQLEQIGTLLTNIDSVALALDQLKAKRDEVRTEIEGLEMRRRTAEMGSTA